MFTFIVKLVKMLQKYYMLFVTGTWNTLWISAVTVLLGTLLGMVIALMRMGKIKPFRLFTDVYIDNFNNIRVVQQRNSLAFVFKTSNQFFVFEKFLFKELHCNCFTSGNVNCFVNV